MNAVAVTKVKGNPERLERILLREVFIRTPKGPNAPCLTEEVQRVAGEEYGVKAGRDMHGDIFAGDIASNDMVQELIATRMTICRPSFPLLTGTAFAYVAPGKTLREGAEGLATYGKHFVVYGMGNGKRRLFPVPEEHLDKRHVVLVTDHLFDPVLDGKDIIMLGRASAPRISALENFPPDSGLYALEPEYGIPIHGVAQTTEQNPAAAYHLVRLNGNCVGLVGRMYELFDAFDFTHFPVILAPPHPNSEGAWIVIGSYEK